MVAGVWANVLDMIAARQNEHYGGMHETYFEHFQAQTLGD